MKALMLPQEATDSGRDLAILGLVCGALMIATAALASLIGSPFVVWFDDAPLLLLGMLMVLMFAGVFWDGTLIVVGLLAETAWRIVRRRTPPPVTVDAVRRIRFFNCGVGPIPMLLVTALALLGTSNITLMSLELLSDTTRWRDPFFWSIEGPLLQRIAALPIDPTLWDRLYHSAWGIELGAAFALVVIGRGGGTVLRYCVTMILLFYVGRLLGMLNPVMGPAFHRPEVFAYLEGSTTAEVMRLVADLMAKPAEAAASRASGILLGGISAMPSLHVAMVTTTAYWLAVAGRWTLYVTVPWVLLVWTSTVVLGWHYMLDGAGGIVLAFACIALARRLADLVTDRWSRPELSVRSATIASSAGSPAALGTATLGQSVNSRSGG
jgi:membrane-associated phospholipid phosphatase